MYQEIELISKRNRVLRIKDNGKSYIRKIFSNESSFHTELEVLEKLQEKSYRIPRILETGNNEITFNDLGDVTLLDWLEDAEKNGITQYEDIINDLLALLNELYTLFRQVFNDDLILSDMNFRNFIIFEGKLHRVDFEQVSRGSKSSDLGKLLAFLMNYYPENSNWKKAFRDSLIRILEDDSSMNMSEILIFEQEEIKAMIKRRSKG